MCKCVCVCFHAGSMYEDSLTNPESCWRGMGKQLSLLCLCVYVCVYMCVYVCVYVCGGVYVCVRLFEGLCVNLNPSILPSMSDQFCSKEIISVSLSVSLSLSGSATIGGSHSLGRN